MSAARFSRAPHRRLRFRIFISQVVPVIEYTRFYSVGLGGFSLDLTSYFSLGSFDSFIKIWNLFGSENEQLLDNIRIHGISSDPQPCIVSAPIFSVNDVHDRQIDCVRWILRDPVNYYLVSKASDETILIWMPMLSEANKTPGVRTEWQLCHKIRLKNNKFWFIKFALSYEPYCVLALGDDLGCIKLHDIYALAAKTKVRTRVCAIGWW